MTTLKPQRSSMTLALLTLCLSISRLAFGETGFPVAQKDLGLCIETSAARRCFSLEGSNWVQDLGAGLRATTPVGEKELKILETEMTDFRGWSKSELAKRPHKKTATSECRFTIRFSVKRKTETLCYDTIQGRKFDAKLESVVRRLSLPKAAPK